MMHGAKSNLSGHKETMNTIIGANMMTKMMLVKRVFPLMNLKMMMLFLVGHLETYFTVEELSRP
jgi:hypothetical protein